MRVGLTSDRLKSLYTKADFLNYTVFIVPFFLPIIGGLLAAGLVGGTLGIGVGAAAVYYSGRPLYYPFPAANYAPYPYSYAIPPYPTPGRVCPHCGIAL